MPDDKNNVWVDSTFISPDESQKDISTNVLFSEVSNISSYTIPVIYQANEPNQGNIDVWIQYVNDVTIISGTENVPEEYFGFQGALSSGTVSELLEFFSGRKDLDFDEDTPIIYSTGYNVVSGTLNKLVSFISGREINTTNNVPTFYSTGTVVSGVNDWWVNYTNFSGDLTVSGGYPIPFHDSDFTCLAEYGADYTMTSGALSNTVDISFAGWVPFQMPIEAYSVDEGYILGYEGEVLVISGSLGVNYVETTCSLLTTSGIDSDVYSVVSGTEYLNNEVETIKGRLGLLTQDVFSSEEEELYLSLDIDLLSLKISNFSLDEGEFTTASGFISVDVTDDECPVSVSGTYFKVDGEKVPVTLSPITDGYRMYYDPDDDFGSIEGPITFTAHAENECGDYLEQDYYLTFGYIIEYDNYPDSGMDYGFDNKVAVRVTAENYASCPQISSLAWDFESTELKHGNLGASIVGKFHAWENEGLPAQIYPQSTAYFYGKEFRVVVTAKDFAGREMQPLVLSYKIENKPEN